MTDALWQDDWDKNGFQSSFLKALNAKDINMMQYLAANPKSVSNFGKTKWRASHTIAFGIRSHQMNVHRHRTIWKQFFIKQKLDQFHFSQCGYLPIHLACKTNNAAVLQLIIDTIDKKDLEKLLNHVKKDKYWQYTPLIIGIENDSIDCVKILCNFDEIDFLKIKARYPNYNSLQFACYCNNVNILKIIVSTIMKKVGQSIFTTEMIDEMLEITKRGRDRKDSSHEQCIQYISTLTTTDHGVEKDSVVTSPTIAKSPTANSSGITIVIQQSEDNDSRSNNTVFDYRASRMKIVHSRHYTCNSTACKILNQKLETLASKGQCFFCEQRITINDIGYICGNCHFIFCEECAFVVSIINTHNKANFGSLMRNQEFITLLRNDKKIVTTVQ